jgi:hypothetical protein
MDGGHWPDLSVSGSASYSQGDYFSDGGTSMSQSWEVLTELDFAKFWPEVLDSEDEGMLLVFQLKGDSSREKWGDDVSGDSGNRSRNCPLQGENLKLAELSNGGVGDCYEQTL